MKPRQLVMQAFGPYADKETIDFSVLRDQQLFLITGPTGSGKTTILDAMTFALYGTASGDLRENRSLRSDYASPKVRTEVQLVFTNQDRTYEVTRSPEQELVKQRGEGTRSVPAGASLVEIDEKGERTLLASSYGAVTKEVEAILGFKAAQFRQLMVLPQGEFRRFLMADSKERRIILETLFKTQAYRKLEEALDARAKALKKDYDEAAAKKAHLLEQAQTASLEELVQVLSQNKHLLKEKEKEAAEMSAVLKKATAALEGAKKQQDLFASYETVCARRKALEEKEGAIESLKKKLKLLDEAQKLHAPYDRAWQSLNRARQAEALEKEAEKDYARALEEVTARSQKATSTNTALLQEEVARAREELARMTAVSGEMVRLAGSLEKGKPCPVCGSLTHPHPATQTQEDKARLQKEQHDLEEKITALKKEQDALEKAQGALKKAAGSLETAKRSAKEAAHALDYDKEAFKKALEASPFPDQPAFLAAHHDLSQKEALQEEVNRFEAQKASTEGELKILQKEIAGKEKPLLAPFEEKEKAARSCYEAVAAQQGALSERIAREEKELDTLKSLEEKIAKLQDDYGPIGLLAATAKGQNSENLSFSAYVLQAILDDVLKAANLRLSAISEGRYTLYRREGIHDARKEQGLDLEILDAYTGQARSVHTLSGGESFFTSLSLALGLSDVLESYAGGLHLDTILVDEGFGSLDPETLDKAMNTLMDLQKGGRLVGIISHVAELKERIPAQLIVRGGVMGSHASFRV